MTKKRIFSERDIDTETIEIIKNLKETNNQLKLENVNLNKDKKKLMSELKIYEEAVQYSRYIIYGTMFINVSILIFIGFRH
jgi:hypothetical protein